MMVDTIDWDLIGVALLAEGVGRNRLGHLRRLPDEVSPSSRRAWVEIIRRVAYLRKPLVALLAEGVGRNSLLSFRYGRSTGRPPRGGRG